ncbi:MAG: hypothetical protein A3D47_00595 [Candidatus Colwellbacteria bacterium RIFCSPHIGHO2_02_FULL_43_15]|uniref:RecF/RecN/SMC N-terminal domain-containing protein n=1 Tax=Candidatus Colwellbacteria bacterium RIFCSPHIGHO2_02_FULL_43_15 TaxID=1797686 RepID=A0A1G1YY53_9BACT|nr:MAG: hypothetical protein A3D47_00595 [Candidatus Colwellbacteria bacterium RIFCSPHIGHO2_02_FULL_43_15]
MFLRKLELQGFKSFADKISLDLSHGITAVVGPNGSGKSNITDALRWLLGEREARNLRGGKVEDLIFAGTKDRPRMGMAQASMYFDNSSGFFPVDYKEVSVSRRLSRDGESEILLNKSEIRLKDVIDFFAKSRMGARGLSIVSQGESDIFINSTPLERREMIEEILGLKEYQIKKAEAVRRLKNTGFNLEKANALIGELAPHLRMLKKQVSRYEGREEIAGELNELENRYYGSRLKKIKDALLKLQPALKDAEKELSKQEVVTKKLEAEITDVRNSGPETDEKIKVIQEKRKNSLDRKFNFQKDLNRLETRLELTQNLPDVKEVNLLAALKDVRNLAYASVEEGTLERLKDTVSKIVSLIDNLFSKGNDASGELKKSMAKLEADIKQTDKELKDLDIAEADSTKHIRQFNEKFKEIFIAFESERNKLIKLKDEKNSLVFESEKLDIKLKDLSVQILEIGRKASDFDVWSGVPLEDEEVAVRRMFRLRGELSAIGEIDQNTIKDYKETEERHTFLVDQVSDLEKAVTDLNKLIEDLDYKIRHEFNSAISHISEEFNKYINALFGGGKAKLTVEEEKDERALDVEVEGLEVQANEKVESGVYIDVSFPRKSLKGLEVLSGGEKALVSIAALFALISVSPPPFLVLDEIDAPLDEINARRFGELLKNFSKKTQFLIVTHNRATMEAADVLYGVTMSADGTSQVLSIKLN